MAKLTDRQNELIHLRDEERLTFSDIAARLGITKSSAHSSYHNAKMKACGKPKAFGQTCEVKKPEETAVAIDALTDPFTTIREAGEQCGFPPRTLNNLIKRMKARYGPLDQAIREVKNGELILLLEDVARRSLEYIDDFTLGQASARDLAITAGVAIDKAQLLKGEPTTITKIQDIKKLDEVGDLLLREMERRGLVDVTPDKADASPPSVQA